MSWGERMWITIWTGLGAVSDSVVAGLSALRVLPKRRRKLRRQRVLLSMQMSDLSEAEYLELRQYLIDVVRDLRKEHDVEFFNESIRSQEEFLEEAFDPEAYLRCIAACDVFIGIISHRIVSSIYLEVGYALAKEKNIVLFVHDENYPPFLLRKVARTHPSVKLNTWKSTPNLGPQIWQVLRHF